MSVSVLLSLVDARILNELTPKEVDEVTRALVDHIESDTSLKKRLTAVVEDSAQELLDERHYAGS